jgi:predicted  nucleic acid-binding Zn-ribbon protein
MHLQAMEQYCKKLSELEHELELSQHDVLELETRGIKMPKDWQVLNDRLKAKNKQLHLDNTTHRSQINNYVQELSRLKNLSWWDRLWNYRIYV